MLSRTDGQLADLIIHELTHATLFVKDSLEFNENLATFIGNRGSEMFIRQKFGESSKEYEQLVNSRNDRKKFNDHVLRGVDALDTLYASFRDDFTDAEKSRKKKIMIDSIMNACDTLSLYNQKGYQNYVAELNPNNTFFMSYIRYRSKQDALKEMYEEQFNKDLKDFLAFLKNKYPSL